MLIPFFKFNQSVNQSVCLYCFMSDKNTVDWGMVLRVFIIIHLIIHNNQFYWGTVDTEIKVPSVENPELTNVLYLKPGERLYKSSILHSLPGISSVTKFLPSQSIYLPFVFFFFFLPISFPYFLGLLLFF